MQTMTQRDRRNLAIVILLGLYSFLIYTTAWMSDDAYITLRTIDNFMNGYGLRWNVAYRVQTFTHPLWMMIEAVVYALTREPFLSMMALSAVVSLAGFFLLLRTICRDTAQMITVALVLFSTPSFIDFSTSGLENPLTHLLIIFFCLVVLAERITTRRLFLAALCSSLLMLTRPDSILLVAPALAMSMWRWSGREAQTPVQHRLGAILTRGVAICFVGFLPFILWSVFSLWYYGFLFPNTAYAKLNSGFPREIIFARGLGYLADFFLNSPIAAMAVVAAIVAPLWRRNRHVAPFAAGIALSLLYVVTIGGDFMSGRFLTPTLILAMVTLAQLKTVYSPSFHKIVRIAAVAFFLFDAPTRMDVFWQTEPRSDFNNWGIADERSFYKNIFSLQAHRTGFQNLTKWETTVREIKGQKRSGVSLESGVGFPGYNAGPDATLVDVWGIIDPLLSRLHATPDHYWRVGHFQRDLPEGYLLSLEQDRNRIHNRDLGMFYDHLLLLIREPLNTPGRWKEIWRFNTGQYDAIKQLYPPVLQATAEEMAALADAFSDDGTTGTQIARALDLNGIEIALPHQTTSAYIINVETNDDYRVEFRNGSEVVSSVKVRRTDFIPPWEDRRKAPSKAWLHSVVVAVPRKAITHGYTAMRIVPEMGFTPWRVGRVIADPASPLPEFRGAKSGI